MADRIITVLQCSVCKNKNYYFASNKRKDFKIEINKFCRKCRKHTLHKMVKSS